MSAVRLSVMALVLLAGCDGNPFPSGGSGSGGGGGTTPPATTAVPASVKGNMNSASYTPGDPTIKINMTSQDASILSASYKRNPTYDVAGYTAYTYQETTSNRYVLALVKQTGSAKGLVAVEGGQFANYHGGGDFVRATADVFTLPTSGVGAPYTYSGSYVGLMNVGEAVPGPGGDLDPTRAYRTTGRALITADFMEMSISGGVDQRSFVDASAATNPSLPQTPLSTISLFQAPITASGTFAGKVKIGENEVGDYAGLFAGLNASQIATLLVFTPYVSSSIIKEHGLIVLGNCAAAGGPACP
jgi:hypothetical protein